MKVTPWEVNIKGPIGSIKVQEPKGILIVDQGAGGGGRDGLKFV